MALTRIVPSRPALILEGDSARSLVVADVHIGFERSLSSGRISVGKNTATREAVGEISDIIDSERPDSVVLLGDVKSSVSGISGSEWDDVPAFLGGIAKRCDVTLVPGNHDANIQQLAPRGVSMGSTAGIVEDNVLLTHGHAMPPGSFSHVDKIIMGHVHPVFFEEGSLINGQRVWVSLMADKDSIFPDRSGTIEVIVVPSFNRYLYATHRRGRGRPISPIIDRIRSGARARIVTLDGTIIGNESMIDRVV